MIIISVIIISIGTLASIIMGGFGVSSYVSSSTTECWLQRERLISRAFDALSTKETSNLAEIFSEDVVVDFTESGGFGPIVGLNDLTLAFEFLAMVIRTQTASATNTLADSCPGPAQVNLISVQAMDQILLPGDVFLPAILTGAIAYLEFSPDNRRITNLVLQPGVTQVFISPQLSGVNIPSVKKKKDTEHELELHMWEMMQKWITNTQSKGQTHLVTLLQNTPAYHQLSELSAKK